MKLSLLKQDINKSILWEDIKPGDFFVTRQNNLCYKIDDDTYIFIADSEGNCWGDSYVYYYDFKEITIIKKYRIDKWEY